MEIDKIKIFWTYFFLERMIEILKERDLIILEFIITEKRNTRRSYISTLDFRKVKSRSSRKD